MLFKLKTLIVLFVVGLLIGFGTALLVLNDNTTPTTDNSSIAATDILQQQAVIATRQYQLQLTGLQNRNQYLQQELESTKTLLSKARQQTTQRKERIEKLLATDTSKGIGYPAKALLQKVRGRSNIDGAELPNPVNPCDSLKEEVSNYIQEDAVKDSLYEAQLKTQDSIIAVKDSTINTQEQQIRSQDHLLKQSLKQQNSLETENLELRSQKKKQKKKGKLLAMGSAILSGLLTSFIIHR